MMVLYTNELVLQNNQTI